MIGLTDAAAWPWLTALLIFVAEACVVTIATMRSIFVSRGMKAASAVLGLIEASVWLFAVGQVFENLSNISCSIAYAAGFTLGNYLGVLLEQKVAVGNVLLRVVTSRDAAALVRDLTDAGFGVTRMNALGANGPVQVVLTVVKRRELGASSPSSKPSILASFTPWTICTRPERASSLRNANGFQGCSDGPAPPDRPTRQREPDQHS